MKTTLNVLFKKMQKDDKKEILHFQVQGDELPYAEKLVEMAGGIVILEVDGCEAGEVTAEFATLQRDSKKTVLKFAIKGDSEDKAVMLYRHAGTNVTLHLEPSQMSIDDFYDEPAAGLQYTVHRDGTVDVDQNQVTIDEVAAAADKVTDLEEERRKRRKKDDSGAMDDDLLPDVSDDDLPF